MSKDIKVFEVAEDEWIAAENLTSAIEYYKDMVGDDTYEELREEFGEPVELNNEQLKKMISHDEDSGEMSFFDRLALLLAETADFPQFFATGNM